MNTNIATISIVDLSSTRMGKMSSCCSLFPLNPNERCLERNVSMDSRHVRLVPWHMNHPRHESRRTKHEDQCKTWDKRNEYHSFQKLCCDHQWFWWQTKHKPSCIGRPGHCSSGWPCCPGSGETGAWWERVERPTRVHKNEKRQGENMFHFLSGRRSASDTKRTARAQQCAHEGKKDWFRKTIASYDVFAFPVRSKFTTQSATKNKVCLLSYAA